MGKHLFTFPNAADAKVMRMRVAAIRWPGELLAGVGLVDGLRESLLCAAVLIRSVGSTPEPDAWQACTTQVVWHVTNP